jgi:hypothetical protein
VSRGIWLLPRMWIVETCEELDGADLIQLLL